jgi:predicted methyltransferase MtxX (methanogen marker protein 4)
MLLKLDYDKINNNPIKMNVYELNWARKEVEEIGSRITKLRVDQIAALMTLSGVKFNFKDIENVAKEIKENGMQSGHLEIVIYESSSKENLLWWLEFFGKHNQEK